MMKFFRDLVSLHYILKCNTKAKRITIHKAPKQFYGNIVKAHSKPDSFKRAGASLKL